MLFLSFWDIYLDNLPEGTFTRRRIPAAEAKLLIDQARLNHALRCLSQVDVLAPYKARERDRYQALCRVLSEHVGIALTLEDFLSKEVGGDAGYTIRPLSIAQVKGPHRMLVVTCNYTMQRPAAGPAPAFAILPETVEYHLIEAGK